jgi:hypothetical protein
VKDAWYFIKLREILDYEKMSLFSSYLQKYVTILLLFGEIFGQFLKIIINKCQIYLEMLINYPYFKYLNLKIIKNIFKKKLGKANKILLEIGGIFKGSFLVSSMYVCTYVFVAVVFWGVCVYRVPYVLEKRAYWGCSLAVKAKSRMLDNSFAISRSRKCITSGMFPTNKRNGGPFHPCFSMIRCNFFGSHHTRLIKE